MLIKKHEGASIKHLTGSEGFIKYSNDMDDIYKNIQECNLNKKRKILIVFDGMIADMLSNKDLFIRERKLNISVVFVTQPYFGVPKNIRVNSTYYFFMKIPNKEDLQQVVFNFSSYIKYFMNLYKKCTAKPYSFLVINATLASYNALRFRKNLLERI